MVEDGTTIQGVFPTSSANITCLPDRMWPGCSEEGPFLLVLDMLDKEEHLEKVRRVHYSSLQGTSQVQEGYERPRPGQGWSWLNWDRVEPPMGTGNSPAARSKLKNFEHDILRDTETQSVIVQANAYCWNLP